MIEIPDANGLSSDSLRGSTQHIRPDLIGATGRVSPDTGQPLTRDPLSASEILALRGVGLLVDENGYEVKPEPITIVAPIPVPMARVRPDLAANPELRGHQDVEITSSQSTNWPADTTPPIAPYPGTPLGSQPAGDWRTENPDNPVRPFGGIPVKNDNPHRDFSELPGMRRSRSDAPNPPAVESEGMHFEDDEPNGAKDSD